MSLYYRLHRNLSTLSWRSWTGLMSCRMQRFSRRFVWNQRSVVPYCGRSHQSWQRGSPESPVKHWSDRRLSRGHARYFGLSLDSKMTRSVLDYSGRVSGRLSLFGRGCQSQRWCSTDSSWLRCSSWAQYTLLPSLWDLWGQQIRQSGAWKCYQLPYPEVSRVARRQPFS